MEWEEPSSWRDFEHLRQIRNDCRSYMTGSQDYITIDAQVAFRKLYRSNSLNLKVFLGIKDGIPLAYALIKWDDNKCPWISGGIIKSARGLGLGRELFSMLTDSADPKPARLEVLADNKRALGLYLSLGWETESERTSDYGDILTMVIG